MELIVMSYKLTWNAHSNEGNIKVQLSDFSDTPQWVKVSFTDPAEFAAVHQMLRTEGPLTLDPTTHVFKTATAETGAEDEGGD